MTEKTLSVTAIKHGIAIDHIRAGQALHIIQVFQLDRDGSHITAGINLSSKGLGKKDIIKITDADFSENLLHGISVFAPEATINLIENFKVIKKFSVSTPEEIKRVLICPNPKCITNHEPDDSYFHIDTQKNDIKLLCHYCEKSFDLTDIHAYNPL